MRSTAIGVLLATLAMFAWGMLYWGANPAPYTAWQQTRDDAAAGRAILQHFPVSGTYYLPGLYNDAETRSKLHELGPVAFVDYDHLSPAGSERVARHIQNSGILQPRGS